MTRSLLALLPCLAFAAPPVVAHEGHAKCDMPVQACLDELASDVKGRGWVGIEMDKSEGPLKIVTVVPESPAAAAGLQAGDVLVSVNGARYDSATPEELKKATTPWKSGTVVTYQVQRGGVERDVKVTLGAMPEKVASQIVGHHMLEHASGGDAAKVASLKELSVDEVAKILAAGKGTACDANGAPLRKSHGTLPGARLLTSAASYDAAKELPADKEKLLVFYCANTRCTAAESAAERAMKAGYKNVAVMRAGIMGWKDAGQSTSPAT